MREFEKLDLLTKKGNGFLTTSSVIAESISKTTLAKYIRVKNFERVAHGVYLSPNGWKDEAYIVHLRCPQIVFSHDYALFLHELTDREPLNLTVTLKTGYNSSRLTADGIKVYTVKSELYPIGITEGLTPFGNAVTVYDLERTVCDIVRSRKTVEAQIYRATMKQYARREDKNLRRLMEYARLFHIEKVVREYMEALL